MIEMSLRSESSIRSPSELRLKNLTTESKLLALLLAMSMCLWVLQLDS